MTPEEIRALAREAADAAWDVSDDARHEVGMQEAYELVQQLRYDETGQIVRLTDLEMLLFRGDYELRWQERIQECDSWH
jgi:hypothetical protein